MRAPYLLRLLAHQPDELLAADAVGIAGMVVGAGYALRAALAVIDDEDVEMEAREVDRGGQPGGSAADDQAIEWFSHSWPNGLPQQRFPTSPRAWHSPRPS